MIEQTQCNIFKLNLLRGLENFAVGTDYTYKIALYTSDATLNADTTEYTTDNEVVSSGYTAGGAELTPIAPQLNNGVAVLSFANVSWSPATFTTAGALIYNATTNASVAVLNFGGSKMYLTEFTITFPTADANNAVIKII
tara:strand:- start:11069 stop:11488 length:420 start_codon:yes stop_codon:yes gene_type:complete